MLLSVARHQRRLELGVYPPPAPKLEAAAEPRRRAAPRSTRQAAAPAPRTPPHTAKAAAAHAEFAALLRGALDRADAEAAATVTACEYAAAVLHALAASAPSRPEPAAALPQPPAGAAVPEPAAAAGAPAAATAEVPTPPPASPPPILAAAAADADASPEPPESLMSAASAQSAPGGGGGKVDRCGAPADLVGSRGSLASPATAGDARRCARSAASASGSWNDPLTPEAVEACRIGVIPPSPATLAPPLPSPDSAFLQPPPTAYPPRVSPVALDFHDVLSP
eukprot:TRINITY_DN14732_c0_g1_i2.p1 TRINITY_DN14732_c0_g1~~TRINITY_DN14732_c0_g1_i2.p1  ORF type:complete len:281 (+),score=56.09 TRINITY_DN14732_c0_g1_i2:74-916(+)